MRAVRSVLLVLAALTAGAALAYVAELLRPHPWQPDVPGRS